jgi:cardiolipin synthase
MAYSIISASALILVIILISLVLFEPGLPYEVKWPNEPLDSEAFCCLVGALANAEIYRNSQVEVLKGGEVFYEAELAAIRQAKQSIHLEAYLFHPSPIADRFIEAFTERARAGVAVKIVLDTVGSWPTPNRYFRELRAAGGIVKWYQPFRWSTLKRINNRTHRELLIIDGSIGFIGGAGISAHWLGGEKGEVPWCDMMCRVRGPLVVGLQSCFAENWLESSGCIMADPAVFASCHSGADGEGQISNLKTEITNIQSEIANLESEVSPSAIPRSALGLVVTSTPTAARSTRARTVFQLLMASARKSIQINSPYFVPDRSARRELIRAAQRGVHVQIITPGKANNHPMTRRSSQRRYGPLLQAGIEIYEYQPGMIHKKAMMIDGLWSVIGSTNFDNRSFGLNDEVNLAALDPAVSHRLESDFGDELNQSLRITFEAWSKRSWTERVLEEIGRIFERQE